VRWGLRRSSSTGSNDEVDHDTNAATKGNSETTPQSSALRASPQASGQWDPSSVARLIDMGFERVDVEAALAAKDGDEHQAADWLLVGGTAAAVERTSDSNPTSDATAVNGSTDDGLDQSSGFHSESEQESPSLPTRTSVATGPTSPVDGSIDSTNRIGTGGRRLSLSPAVTRENAADDRDMFGTPASLLPIPSSSPPALLTPMQDRVADWLDGNNEWPNNTRARRTSLTLSSCSCFVTYSMWALCFLLYLGHVQRQNRR
jgi:hypothetical protein